MKRHSACARVASEPVPAKVTWPLRPRQCCCLPRSANRAAPSSCPITDCAAAGDLQALQRRAKEHVGAAGALVVASGPDDTDGHCDDEGDSSGGEKAQYASPEETRVLGRLCKGSIEVVPAHQACSRTAMM